jgi:hypothetical protein
MEHPLEGLARVARMEQSFQKKAAGLAARLAALEQQPVRRPAPPPALLEPLRGWPLRLGLFWLLVAALAVAAFTAGYIIARAGNSSGRACPPSRFFAASQAPAG